MGRRERIELSSDAWKAPVLPLNEHRENHSPPGGISPEDLLPPAANRPLLFRPGLAGVSHWENGAHDQGRTDDLRFTKALLYR